MRHLPKLLGILPLLVVLSGCPHAERQEFPAARTPALGHATVQVPSTQTDPQEPSQRPDVPPAPPAPSGANPGEAALREIKAKGATVTQDPGSGLLSIDLAKSQAGDEVIMWLAAVPNIQQLDLAGTQISDEGLAKLSPMPVLEFLNLAHTPVGDAGLGTVSSLPKLKFIVLNGTKITDKGLAVLAQSRSLEGVSLIDTQITPAAAAAFQEQRPNCTLIFREGSAPKTKEASDKKSSTAMLNYWETLDSRKHPAAGSELEAMLAASPADKKQAPAEVDVLAGSWRPSKILEAAQGPTLPSAEPGSSLELDLQDAAFLKTISEVYIKRQEWSKAVIVLKQAVKLDPANSSLRHQLGIALGRVGDLEDSYLELRHAGGEAAAHYNMGVILYENALKQSGEHFQQALLLDPGLAEARTWLRFLKEQAGNPLESPFEPTIVPAAGFALDKKKS
jgi:tetratricopeptide (TPR) repeat protein